MEAPILSKVQIIPLSAQQLQRVEIQDFIKPLNVMLVDDVPHLICLVKIVESAEVSKKHRMIVGLFETEDPLNFPPSTYVTSFYAATQIYHMFCWELVYEDKTIEVSYEEKA